MKKFLIKLSYTVLPVFLLLFGLVAYVSLYLTPRLSGDLGNLAYIPFNLNDDDEEHAEVLFRDIHTLDELKTAHADVLTIGDSFAQQGSIGFQNFLSSQGLSVINCDRKMYDSPLQFSYNVFDEGFVDSTKVNVVVVEIGEHDVPARFGDFRVGKKEHPVISTSNKKTSNKWSLLRTRDFVLYRFAGRSPVYDVKLDCDLFDSDEPRRLYFYYADIIKGVSLDENIKLKIISTFRLLQQKAQMRGVGLVLMVPVDKYDLYQNHIVDNPYPVKTINEDLHNLFGDMPEVLLCKYCLVPLLEKGEKNLFLIDDSHWGPKASEVVAKELAQRIKLVTSSKN